MSDDEPTADERLKQADEICEDLKCVDLAEFSRREIDFVEGMGSATFCSKAQLDWLRKIKQKYWR